MAYLTSPRFSPTSEVVLNQEPPVSLSGATVTGDVQWLERGINSSRLGVRTESPALLVLAENWYPAWKARVDGVEQEVLRANHSLRAVALEAGEHEVEVYFDPGTLAWPLWTSILSLLVVAALAGATLKRGKARDDHAGD